MEPREAPANLNRLSQSRATFKKRRRLQPSAFRKLD